MKLYEKWEALAEQERTQQEYDKYWRDYFEKEMHVYEDILENKTTEIKGTVAEISKRYNLDEVTMAGFLSGINTSLESQINLEELEEDTELDIKIDYEKLYYNMLAAKAEWLYGLPQWDDIFTAEKRKEIKKEYNKTRTVVKEHKVGRNDPCPCGSGKKYKKCCGKNE